MSAAAAAAATGATATTGGTGAPLLRGAVTALPLWTVRRAPWLLVALHVPFVVAAPLFTITRRPDIAGPDAAVLVVLAVALGGLQLRHSIAVSRGRRPGGWPLTFAVLLALAYVPTWWHGFDWATSQWMVIASGALLLRGRLAVAAVALPTLGTAAMAFYVVRDADVGSILQAVMWAVYYTAILLMGGAALYGSARLVRVVDELYAARTEVAELAVGRERLRVSRDLHDLLGQSLSAVSLKGDLALRLLATDADAARAEIESLTGVARGALRDVRAVARDEHAVSLAAEVDAAAALLTAAGIDVRLDVDLAHPPPPVEEVLAWAVREGATNMLRHSDAASCSITAGRREGRARLVVVNDGVRGPVGEGRGLAGLTERARELAGSVSARPFGDGRFRLVVEVPEGVT